MYRIFMIEDDRTIANAVKTHLEKWGFEAKEPLIKSSQPAKNMV